MTSRIDDAAVAALWLGVTLYAVLGGADFGGGMWDLLAGGDRRGEVPREVINAAINPVWEANHVWLIFDLVVLWTAFGPAFSSIMSTAWVPVLLALGGIVMRGSSFAFRKELRRPGARRLTGAVFAASSLVTPFFMGTVIGAIATGRIAAGRLGNLTTSWVNATSLVIGALFVLCCAFLSAVYLCTSAAHQGHPELRAYFVRRAVASGLLTGALALAVLGLLDGSDRWLFERLTGRALPFVVLSGVLALAALGVLVRGGTFGTRPLAAGAVALVIWGWGVAQYPYLLPRSLTIEAGAAPAATIGSLLVVGGIVAVLVLPSFGLVFMLAGRQKLIEDDSAVEGAGVVGVEPGVLAAEVHPLHAAGRQAARQLGGIGVVVAFAAGWWAGRSSRRTQAPPKGRAGRRDSRRTPQRRSPRLGR